MSANRSIESSKGRRISIDLTAAAAAEVDRLRQMTDLNTADMFRYALHLFRIYVDERARKNVLFFAKEDSPTERPVQIELPLTISVLGGREKAARSAAAEK